MYRIRGSDNRILYIGEGIIAARLAVHRKSASIARSAQGEALATAKPLTCSWVINAAWADHHRLELENDLIAAWVLAKGSDVVPIPGTKRITYLEENLGAVDVDLTGDDLARLDTVSVGGERWIDPTWVYRTTPPTRR